MPNVWSTTKPMARELPISKVAGRIITSQFRKSYFRFCTSHPVLGVLMVPPSIWGQFFFNLRSLLRLRRQVQLRLQKPRKIRIAFWADTLDEVNGIANNIRLTVRTQREKGRGAHLWGAVTRHRDHGHVENSSVILFPLAFGMPQLGYPDSELATPHLGPILRWMIRYTPDVVELQTPNPGSWVMLFICKLVGIPVISHYRTDANGYTRMLVQSRFMHWYVGALIKIFSRVSTPIVTPSKDFSRIVVEEMGVKPSQVKQLPRGIDLANFSPALRNQLHWDGHSQTKRPIRFLFTGRVSVEKSLPFLVQLWKEFRTENQDCELFIVGHGPYLEEMKSLLKNCPDVVFTGQLSGTPLYALFADADYFVFPSGNDTFGNVVVESLASGTPALLADRGGPKDIVEGTDCGIILPFLDHLAWKSALHQVAQAKSQDPEAYQALRQRCHLHAQNFSLSSACDAQWEFLSSLARNPNQLSNVP